MAIRVKKHFFESPEDFRLRRRRIIRRRAAKVARGIREMQEKAACPPWLKRKWQKLWGEIEFVIDKEDVERLKMAAHAATSRLYRTAAEKLNLDPKVQKAFNTLNLPPWATLAEMMERHAYLIKMYHPDVSNGDSSLAAGINAARDTLLSYYTVSGIQKSKQP